MKLSAWKASLLTMAGRVQLVKAVIQSMMIYSITLYSWPISLIKEVERNIRNKLLHMYGFKESSNFGN
jgi:hypothetical protein